MTSYLWILVLASLAGTRAQDFDLSAALDPDPTPEPEKKPPKSGGDGLLDLGDALGPDTPSEPSKPAGNPSKSGDPNKPADPPKSEGGEFSLNDAVSGDYKPDPSGGGGARSGGEGQPYDTQGDEGQSQAPQGGQMAGIISAVGVAILGAASSYFAYQKKKLCFKIQGGTDPESGVNQSGTRSDPQVMSNLLKSS
ncbi:CD99 molecule isoform X1 [Hoplias malabaricus]|uniref:CD99 molecule isoform X1 n=1 Tax=Hoplias malabaricus TaxID=27720 RepID=UPI0034635A47